MQTRVFQSGNSQVGNFLALFESFDDYFVNALLGWDITPPQERENL